MNEDIEIVENEAKLLIIYGPKGYNIICEDGTPMEFVDDTPTTNIKDLKEAINICTNHFYKFEIV